MKTPADMAKLAHLLEVQGQLIEQYLGQNMGEPYAYLLLATPRATARSVTLATNIRAEHVAPVAFLFGARIKALDAEAILDPSASHPIGGADASR